MTEYQRQDYSLVVERSHSFLEELDSSITPGNIISFKHQPSQQRQVE